MKNRDLSSPIEYEVIYKDKIVPVRDKPKKYREPQYRPPKKTYKGGFITMTIIAFLVFVLGVGAAGYLIIVKPDFIFPSSAPTTFEVVYRNNVGDEIKTLQTDNVKKGSTSIPEYRGEDPYRPADAAYTYTFNGWEQSGALPVSTNIEMLAKYKRTPKTPGVDYWSVVWMGYDDKGDADMLLPPEEVKDGAIAKWTGPKPTRPATSDYSYTFTGWEPSDGIAVKQNITFTAQFRADKIPDPVIKYHVEWKKYGSDGVNLETYYQEEVEANTRPMPPVDSKPERIDPNHHYEYKFDEWTPDANQPVTRDTTFIPTYTSQEIIPEPKPESYLVRWKDADAEGGRIWDVQQVESGTKVKYEGEKPYKAADAENSYEFDGWIDGGEGVITQETTYTAKYKSIKQENTYAWDESTKSYSIVGSKTGKDFDKLYLDPSKNDGHEAKVMAIGDGTKLILPLSIKIIYIPPFVTSIEENAFDLGRDDFEVFFEDKESSQLKIIKKAAFANYPGTSIDLPDSIEVIEGGSQGFNTGDDIYDGAFAASQFTSFKFPENLRVIEPIFVSADIDDITKALVNNNLSSIKIGKNVAKIESYSLLFSLKINIFIPLNVTEIGMAAIINTTDFRIGGKTEVININCEAKVKPTEWDEQWYSGAGNDGRYVKIFWGASS